MSVKANPGPVRALFIFLVLATLVGWWLGFGSGEHTQALAPEAQSNDSPPGEFPESATDAPTQLAPIEKPEQEDCLTPAQLESHPMMARAADRLAKISWGGPDIEVFRGLSRESVQGIAAQEDSAAMVVLGAMAVLRATGRPEKSAVDYLALTDMSLRTYPINQALEPETAKHWQQAYDWFYKAAMRGRTLALTEAGGALFQLEPSLVAHGWIEQEDFDALSRREKSVLNVQNIYTRMAFLVLRDDTDGVIGMLESMSLHSTEIDRIGRELADQFEKDVQAAGLSKIVIPKSELPTQEEMMAIVCEQYRPKEE